MFEVISWGYIVAFSHYEHAVVFWNGHRSKMLKVLLARPVSFSNRT